MPTQPSTFSHLHRLEKDELLQLLRDLYGLNADNKLFLAARFLATTSEEMAEPYRKIIRRVFNPDRSAPSLNLSAARKALNDMLTILKSTQAQQNLGALIDQALAEGEVVVERNGTPRVAMIDYRRYQHLLASEQELWRARLQQVSQQASGSAAHLSEEEVDALIEGARSEVQQV